MAQNAWNHARMCLLGLEYLISTFDPYSPPKCQNSRWRTAAIFKMVLSLYISQKSSDFNEIWCADANFGSKNGHMTNYHNFYKFKMADDHHIENSFLAISQ